MGARPVWKDESHPLRHHPSYKLSGIPTLVHLIEGAPAARLGPELESAETPDAADALLRDFVSRTRNGSAAVSNGPSTEAVDVQALMQQLQQVAVKA